MMRKGIISAGSWLVDSVKIIEKYPAPGNLITIESVKVGLGGCAHNVLVDLAKMGTGFPLYAGGCVGADDNGKFVLREIERNEIDSRHMTVVADELTAYTDVMAEKGGHSRTYFHYRGRTQNWMFPALGRWILTPASSIWDIYCCLTSWMRPIRNMEYRQRELWIY